MRKKWRKFRKKAKNFILLSITFLACLVWTVCGACLDSDEYIPFFVGVIISAIWIMTFAYANSRK